MNYWTLIEMLLQAAPAEVALVKTITDAVHEAHQNGAPPPVFVPAPVIPPGAIALPIPPAPQAAQPAPAPLVTAPVAVAGSVTVMPDSQPQPVVVTGVPGQKRARDLQNVATPAPGGDTAN